MINYDTDQPWVIYHYGRTHDQWWPFWSSTRVLARACIVCECAVCGDVTPLWLPIPRFGPVPDNGHHPKRLAYLAAHAHPERGAPMSWAKPMLNPAAHPGGGIDLDAFAMRLEADLNCVPYGCLCDCHKVGMYVSHVAACCDRVNQPG